MSVADPCRTGPAQEKKGNISYKSICEQKMKIRIDKDSPAQRVVPCDSTTLTIKSAGWRNYYNSLPEETRVDCWTSIPSPRTVIIGFALLLLMDSTFAKTDGNKIKVGIFLEEADQASRAIEQLNAKNILSLQVLPTVEETLAIDKLIKMYNKIKYRKPDVIVGPYDEMIGLALTKLEVPYIVTSHGIHGTEAYDILPHPHDICSVLLDVIKSYGWTKIGFILEAEQDFRIVERILEDRSLDVKFWKLYGNTKDAMRNILLANRDKNIYKTVVVMAASKTMKLLRMARRLGLINLINEFIILNLESADISNHTLDHIKTNVTTINLMRVMNLNDGRDHLQPSSERTFLPYSVMLDAFRCILEADKLINNSGTPRNTSSTNLHIAQHLKQVHFDGKTGPVAFDKHGRRHNLTFEIYKFNKLQFEKVGEWTSVESEDSRLSLPAPVNKDTNFTHSFPLKGQKVRVVTILEEPFTTYAADHELMTGNSRFKGFAVDLMEEIANMLDFRYELYLVPDGKFGSRLPDGDWNGMIGEVLAQNAAMTIAPLSINAEREKVIDFTKPFKTRGITVLMRTPQFHPSYFQFLKPLSPYVWICTVFAVITVSVALYCLEKFAIIHPPKMAPECEHPASMNVQESCWFVFGSLVQGGTETSPATLGGRILTSAWWLFALMMVSTYTANLAAFLTVKKIQPPISSVTDLATQTQIKYGTVKNSGVETFFKNTKIQAFSNMRTHMTELFPDAMVNSTDEGLRRAKGEHYAFLWDNTVTSYQASIDCDYTEIGPAFDPKGFGLAVPPGATYREDLSLAILRLGDQGKIVELEHKYWKLGRCDSQENSGGDMTSELHLENVAGIFFILLAGLCCALASCIFSSLYHRHRRPK